MSTVAPDPVRRRKFLLALQPDLYAEVKAYADARDLTVTTVIRIALQDLLKSASPPPASTKNGAKSK
jgi:hypothetical protein